jgi:predicted transposase YbfD/YdcC
LSQKSGTIISIRSFRFIQVHRQVERFDTRKKDWVLSEETSYYLCDLELTAKQANTTIREHWGVENKLHYIRDTRFNEDASRIRVNPSIFALLRSFSFNLLRFNKIENISLALYDNALSLDRVLDYKGL